MLTDLSAGPRTSSARFLNQLSRVPGIYRPRHPERTVLYRVLIHYFERFLTEYEGRFEKEYGYFRPVIKEVVELYLCREEAAARPSLRAGDPDGG